MAVRRRSVRRSKRSGKGHCNGGARRKSVRRSKRSGKGHCNGGARRRSRKVRKGARCHFKDN